MTKENKFLYQLIRSILSTMAASDHYSVHHQNNVSVIARLIAQQMKLSQFEVEGIRVGGQLHDIGKAAIPSELLSKYGRLELEEYTLIKTHALRADDILSGIDFPWPVRTMVRQHHERLDGSGYPDGLVSQDICLGARIIAVADVVESMMNARPYRKALGIQATIDEITRKNHLYDQDVSDAFKAVVAKGEEHLMEAIHIFQ